MPLAAPSALDLIRRPQPGGIAFILAAPTANAVTRLTDHLNDTVWPPLEANGTITGFRYRVAKPDALDDPGNYRSAEKSAWRLVRIEVDLPTPSEVGNTPDGTGPINPSAGETVARHVIGTIAAHHPDIVVGWNETPTVTDALLFDRLFRHMDDEDDTMFGGNRDGWHWLLLALIRRLTPTTGTVSSAELSGGRSWAPADALLIRFAHAFLDASDTAGRSAAADHRFLAAHCSRYRRAVHTGGLDHLGRAQGADLIGRFCPTLTGGARTAAITALTALTGLPKRQVASAVADRALDRLEPTSRSTAVHEVARGFAGTRQTGPATGPDRSRPIGTAIIAALNLLFPDVHGGPVRRRTWGPVVSDTDPDLRSWFVSVDLADARVLYIDGFDPTTMQVHTPADDLEVHAARHGHRSAPASSRTVTVPMKHGVVMGVVEAIRGEVDR